MATITQLLLQLHLPCGHFLSLLLPGAEVDLPPPTCSLLPLGLVAQGLYADSPSCAQHTGCCALHGDGSAIRDAEPSWMHSENTFDIVQSEETSPWDAS